jgi:hypothetical protein
VLAGGIVRDTHRYSSRRFPLAGLFRLLRPRRREQLTPPVVNLAAYPPNVDEPNLTQR